MKTEDSESVLVSDSVNPVVPAAKSFPPLWLVNSPTVPTAPAAYYLNRKDQTMRSWACFDNGPIRPVRINGRLAWSVQAIKDLLAQGDQP